VENAAGPDPTRGKEGGQGGETPWARRDHAHERKYRVDTYTNDGPVAATPLPIPTADLVHPQRQLQLPLPAAIIPIAVAELENMIRNAGIERVPEAAVAVERT
jgi:hypothetical protein